MTAVPPALPGTAQNKRLKESHEFTRLLLGKADMRVDYFGRTPPGGGARVTIFRVRLTDRPLARSAKYRRYPSHRHIPNGNSRTHPRTGELERFPIRLRNRP